MFWSVREKWRVDEVAKVWVAVRFERREGGDVGVGLVLQAWKFEVVNVVYERP